MSRPKVSPSKELTQVHTGIDAFALGAITHALIHKKETPLTLLICKDNQEANQWIRDLEFFEKVYPPQTPHTLLSFPYLSEKETSQSRYFDTHCDRLEVLAKLIEKPSASESSSPLVLALSAEALLSPVPDHQSFSEKTLILKEDDTHSLKTLIEILENDFGYDSASLCERPGEYAVRRELIDVYPLNAHEPCRIHFSEDTIASIQSFDPTTQRSKKSLPGITLTPLAAGKKNTSTLLDYINSYSNIRWFFQEPEILEDLFPQYFSSNQPLSFPKIFQTKPHSSNERIALCEYPQPGSLFEKENTQTPWKAQRLEALRTFPGKEHYGQERLEAEQKARSVFLTTLSKLHQENYTLHWACTNQAEEDRLKEILSEFPDLKNPHCLHGTFNKGFQIEGPTPFAPKAKGWILVTGHEVFGKQDKKTPASRKKALPHRSRVDQLLDFSELEPHTYLVHLQHGICRYCGITTIEIQNEKREVISVEFEDKVTLHVPLQESHLLTRYVGLTKSHPKLAKLGSGQWDKTRRAAEKATLDYGAQLLNLQARRKVAPGHAFAVDQPWQKEFEEMFPFKETRDQAYAIDDTKSDMEKPHPMDRLVCGDVGFGKTEVALRAAFKAVMDGKQVAVLAPTTVLTQQHFNTFCERMSHFPFAIEMLSRFRKPSVQKDILKQTAEGQIDILVATHRILSKDVKFKNLGLLIIDEEHRFGVKQKEKIKNLRESIDILAMSATPIPRSLYMALMGVRNLSVIETPPEERLPIETIVKNYHPEEVKQAIEFELKRGGQVFYLHNRVQTIDSVASKLRELIPGAKITVGHGQMDKDELEEIMTEFVAGKSDVLVCTTIIESGLDIPNCNTIIIEGADRFGLSQLYQLRGRVGRFKRQAYAYLLLHRHASLVSHARERLTTMRQYNQLGSGFKIAMRDLELRGAGNLLGAQQSGHIAGVGFDLYCQLLRQSISRLQGEEQAALVRATLRLDFVKLGESEEKFEDSRFHSNFSTIKDEELAAGRCPDIEAHLPHDYISETRLRIDLYRQLAMADSMAKIRNIEESLEDRFGKLPESVKALILMTKIRCKAEIKNIIYVETEGNRLKCKHSSSPQVFLMEGRRFPRLTATRPLLRLREIFQFLDRIA